MQNAPITIPSNYELYEIEKGGHKVYLMKRKKRNKRRKRVKPEPEMVEYNKVLDIAKNWEDTEDEERFKYFYVASYLLGSRVSETLQLHKADFKPKYVNDVEILQATMVTQKTDGDNIIRRPPIFLNGYEREMANMLLEYLDYFSPKEKLFNFSRVTAWRHMRKINFGPMVLTHGTKRHYVDEWLAHPHYFRSLRATHLSKYYRFDTGALQKYFGWSTPAMAMKYSKRDIEYLVGLYKGVI